MSRLSRSLFSNNAAIHHVGIGVGGGGGGGSESSNFLARTSGLSGTDNTNYDTLITGLVNDGVWTKFDAIWIMAAPNSGTSLLNLVSSSFTCTVTGSPSFLAYRGWTGVNGSGNPDYIDTHLNPALGGVKYLQNDAHAGVWSNSSAAFEQSTIGMMFNGGVPNGGWPLIYPRYTTGISVYMINDRSDTGAISGRPASADGRGHFLANRSSPTTQEGYKNKVNQSISPSTSTAPMPNQSIHLLNCINPFNGISEGGWGGQMSAAHVGGSLTPTEVGKLYDRLRTYLTAVGVP